MRAFKSLCFFELIIIAPALFIGVVAMSFNEVSRTLYLQNVIFFIIGWLISCFFLHRGLKKSTRKALVLTILITIILGLTFIDSGVDGVHRWVSLGPIRLHVASIFLPILIIGLWELLEKRITLFVGIVVLLIAFILLYQPDACQLTAFGISMIIVYYKKVRPRYMSHMMMMMLTFIIVISWIFLDDLPPVDYVENILGLVKNMGLAWFVLGIASLVLLLIPFFIFPRDEQSFLSRIIGIYFTIAMVSTCFGNFPVAIMGYGNSPIIGYLIAITWLLESRIKND